MGAKICRGECNETIPYAYIHSTVSSLVFCLIFSFTFNFWDFLVLCIKNWLASFWYPPLQEGFSILWFIKWVTTDVIAFYLPNTCWHFLSTSPLFTLPLFLKLLFLHSLTVTLVMFQKVAETNMYTVCHSKLEKFQILKALVQKGWERS